MQRGEAHLHEIPWDALKYFQNYYFFVYTHKFQSRKAAAFCFREVVGSSVQGFPLFVFLQRINRISPFAFYTLWHLPVPEPQTAFGVFGLDLWCN